jgi:hypothetical protein
MAFAERCIHGGGPEMNKAITDVVSRINEILATVATVDKKGIVIRKRDEIKPVPRLFPRIPRSLARRKWQP